MQQTAKATKARADYGKCLIVEDSTFDSVKLARVMEQSPHNLKVEVAATLRHARGALARGTTKLILLDNNLPDGLGADFALELANDPTLADIPVIMVSDWPSPFMWEKAAKAGVIYVLSKTEFDGRYVSSALSPKRKNRAH